MEQVGGRKKRSIVYHTALKKPRVHYEPLDLHVRNGSVAFVWDIQKLPVPPEYSRCDVLYSELAWRQGVTVFNARAGVTEERTYREYVEAVARVVTSVSIPVFLVLSRQEVRNYPKADQVTEIDYRGMRSALMVYRTVIDPEPRDTVELMSRLAVDYQVLGDFNCGYGNLGRIALLFGKKYVMSDFNPRCIGYIAANIESWEMEANGHHNSHR